MGNCCASNIDDNVVTIDPLLKEVSPTELVEYPERDGPCRLPRTTIYIGDIVVEMTKPDDYLYHVSHKKKTAVFKSFDAMATCVISEARSTLADKPGLRTSIAIKNESGLHLAHLALFNMPGAVDKEQATVLKTVIHGVS